MSLTHSSLVIRHQPDTISSDFTQEVSYFGQRSFYSGADSVTVVLETPAGPKTLTVP